MGKTYLLHWRYNHIESVPAIVNVYAQIYSFLENTVAKQCGQISVEKLFYDIGATVIHTLTWVCKFLTTIRAKRNGPCPCMAACQ
jgi:hypothetical protein